MVLLATEAEKLGLDTMARGVIETIIEESPLIANLDFRTVEGNSWKYNRESALGGAAFYAPNGSWTEGAATFSQVSAELAILGGDADVDNFLQRTVSNVNDQRAIQTMLKAKSVARTFESYSVIGSTTTDPNAFNGLANLLNSGVVSTSGQVLEVSTSGGALTLALLDQLIDLIRPGKPDLLLMSRRTRRKLKSLLVASAHYVESGESSFGRNVMFYDGIPVVISDFVPDTDTGSSSGTSLSSIYAIKLDPTNGLIGIQNGGIETIDVGQLESKDASRIRIRWYCGLALLGTLSLARLSSISSS